MTIFFRNNFTTGTFFSLKSSILNYGISWKFLLTTNHEIIDKEICILLHGSLEILEATRFRSVSLFRVSSTYFLKLVLT